MLQCNDLVASSSSLSAECKTGVAKNMLEIIYFSCIPIIPVLFPLYIIYVSVNGAVEAEKVWGEGVIKADYGEAEGRGGQCICLPPSNEWGPGELN